MQRPVLDALAQHVDDAALADLGREAGEELEAVDVLGVVRVGHRQLLERLGLGGAQEGEELRHIERVGAVVVLARCRRSSRCRRTAAVVRRPCSGVTARPSVPVMCRMMSVSRPFSLVSVVIRRPPRQRLRSRRSGRCRPRRCRAAASSGSRAAASRTSSLPVTTSATRRVRYSRRSSISRSRREMACSSWSALMLDVVATMACLLVRRGAGQQCEHL